MPGAAARAFVADDDDVARLDLVAEDALHRRVLAFEHARGPANFRMLHRRRPSSRCSRRARCCRRARQGRHPWRRHARRADDALLAVEIEVVPARSWLKATASARRPAPPEEIAHASLLVRRDVPAVERIASVGMHGRQSRLMRPARSSSPRIAMMPPARCTSSMCTSDLAGATLHRHGTLRDSGRCRPW
jgi:hypothetical protein